LQFALEDTHYFGLFRGVGGDYVAAAAAGKIHDTPSLFKKLKNELTFNNIFQECKKAFKEFDATLCKELKNPHSLNVSLSVASMALVALIHDTTLYIANIGTCRAVLCSDGNALQLSEEQTFARKDEQERVQNQSQPPFFNTLKVKHIEGDDVEYFLQGTKLNFSRCFGYLPLKPNCIMSPEPEITTHQLSEKDTFLILGSNNFWEATTNDVAVSRATKLLAQGKDAQEVADDLTQNVKFATVMVIVFDT